MERKIFRGIGAVIAGIESNRRFTVVPRMMYINPTDFNSTYHIPIDLDRTPSRAASWSDVEIDDRGIDANGEFLGSATSPSHLTGYHVTSLGGYLGRTSDDIARGLFVGAVFLEDAVFDRHRSKINARGELWPTSGLRSYQLTTITYSTASVNGPFRGKRYAGFHGRLTDKSTSAWTIELIGFTGKSLTMKPVSIDLSSPDHCAPEPPLAVGETALHVTSSIGDEGAIFLELGQVATFDIPGPKLPIGLDLG